MDIHEAAKTILPISIMLPQGHCRLPQSIAAVTLSFTNALSERMMKNHPQRVDSASKPRKMLEIGTQFGKIVHFTRTVTVTLYKSGLLSNIRVLWRFVTVYQYWPLHCGPCVYYLLSFHGQEADVVCNRICHYVTGVYVRPSQL